MPSESAYEKLYQGLFDYDQYWGAYNADMPDWWNDEWDQGTDDRVYGKEIARGLIGDYWSGGDYTIGMEGMPWGEDTQAKFDEFFDHLKTSGYFHDEAGEERRIGYWTSGHFGEEALGKAEYRTERESALQSQLGKQKKYGHQIGKMGFAGGSKGGLMGEASLFDEYTKGVEQSIGAMSEAQRTQRDAWVEELLSNIEQYAGSVGG